MAAVSRSCASRSLVLRGALALLMVLAAPAPPCAADEPAILIWGSEGTGEGQFRWPDAITVGLEAQIWVSDSGNIRAQVFQADGTFVRAVPLVLPELPWAEPSDLSFDPDGHLLVSYRASNRVARFGADGSFEISWGSRGSDPGQFLDPKGVVVDGAGAVYVVDQMNRRVQKFRRDGTFLSAWPVPGPWPWTYDAPMDIVWRSPGTLFVTDTLARITLFSTVGEYLDRWIPVIEPGVRVGIPGACVGPEGELYFTTVLSRTLRLEDPGVQTGFWPQILAPGIRLESPQGVAVNADGYLFIADTFNHRIVRFHESLVPVRPMSWGGIKRGFAER